MKSILLLLFTVIGVSAFSQTDYDPRLLAKFSEERIQQLQEEHPEVIAYWTYYLDHSYVIIDGQTSGKILNTSETLEIESLDEINVLSLGITMDRDRSKSYAISGTTKYLILESNREFANGFNNSKRTSPTK